MIENLLAFVVRDEWRVGKLHIHALRAVLEKPAALVIGVVISRDELAQRRVADPASLDAPVAAPVELEPAVHRRDVRPLGDAAGDHFIHRATIFTGGADERNRDVPGEALARALLEG